METTAHPSVTRRRLLVSVLLGCCVVLTALTGVVVGWFATHLFFFGAQPTGEDHQVAAGAYGAAAAALVLGGLALRVHGTTRWQTPLAFAAAGLLALLTLSSVLDVARAGEPGSGINHWWDGAGGVLACPWVWPLVVAGLLAPLRARSGEPPAVEGWG